MTALIKREIQSFFSSTIGYLVVAIFLVVNGLFLWVFQGDYNILDAGFANLSAFFHLAPWVLIFLIPAVTMRSFSDEKKMGTLELLFTKPLSLRQIVLGKFFGATVLILIALLPTCLYVYTISELGNPPGNWDLGSTLGSYLGLLFLILAFNAIGVFSSSLSENQIVAFIIAVFLCFFMYYGFQALEGFGNEGYRISKLGLSYHYDSISRGIIDTRNALYFLSISFLFNVFTIYRLKK